MVVVRLAVIVTVAVKSKIKVKIIEKVMVTVTLGTAVTVTVYQRQCPPLVVPLSVLSTCIDPRGIGH